MSNDITVLQQGGVPAHLQQGQAAGRNAGALTGTGGAGAVDRISLKQSRFRLIRGGEEVAVIPESHIDVVMLRINEGVTKMYYDQPWNPAQDSEPPTCHSDDGIYPAADSKRIQARTCAECPHNVWGSRINPTTGAQGKACADSKRISVVPASDVRGDAFQLSVPAASLSDLGAYLRKLDSISPPVPYNAVVTRVAFDTNATYPKLLFSPVRYLTEDEYQVAEQERFEADDVKLTAGLPDANAGPQVPYYEAQSNAQAPTQAAPAGPAQPGQAPSQPAGPAQAAPPPAQPAAPAQPATPPQGWGTPGSAPAAASAPAPSQPAGGEQQATPPQGWGAPPTQSPAPQEPAQAGQSVPPQGWGAPPAQEAAPTPAQPAPEQPAPEQPAAAPEGGEAPVAQEAQGGQTQGDGKSLDEVFGGDWDD